MKNNKQPVDGLSADQSPNHSRKIKNNDSLQILSREELICLLLETEEENQRLKEQNANLSLRDTRFRLISINSPDTILFQDRDLIYTWVINATPLMALEQVIGKTDFDLLSPEEADRYHKIKTQLLIDGQSHYEEITTRLNETVHHLSLLFQAWRDTDGKIIGIATYSRDINSQKIAELDLIQQMEGEKLVSGIAAEFISAEIAHIEEQIPTALEKMAGYLQADYGFVRFFDPQNDIIQKGFEWKDPRLGDIQFGSPGLSLGTFKWTKNQLSKNIPIFVQEASDITEEARKEREFLQKNGIKSLVLLPLFIFGEFVGYVGFGAQVSHPLWSEREKSLLLLFRSTIVSVLERQERENTLNESQEQYQKLVELSPNATFLIQEKIILYTNPAGAQLLGFEKPEDVNGKYFENTIHPELLAEYRKQTKQLLGDNPIHPVEISFKNKSNVNVSIEFSSRPIRLRGKQAYLAVGIDISHRKLIEQEIEGNRRFLNDILNISPLAIFVFDRVKNQMAYFNRATCEILGFSPEELSTLNQDQIIRMVHPEELPMAIAMNAKLNQLPAGQVSEGEYRWLKPDGSTLWLHSFQTIISRSPDASILQSLTIAQNITEIKKIQDELKKSEDRFRGLVENIPSIVYQALCDEVFTTIYVSDYFMKLTSFDKNDLLNNRVFSWVDLVHPDDRETLFLEIQKAIKNFTPYEVECRIRKADGGYIWVVDTGRVIYDESNKPLYLNGITTDISTRKRDYEAMRLLSQDNLRLLAQARRDSETKTLLLNEVNHRVKNNIASIIGLLELEGKREIHSTNELQTALSDIKTRITGLATVHDILSSNQWAPVQLELFIRKVIENAAASSPIGRKIVLNIYAQDKNVWINSRQATALALILNELTTNAIRHAFSVRENGTITVTIRKEAKVSNRVHISFSDDGPGWPDEILSGKGGNVGMQVIRLSAISPLYGEIKFENHDGAVATISFNLAPQRDLFKSTSDSNSV